MNTLTRIVPIKQPENTGTIDLAQDTGKKLDQDGNLYRSVNRFYVFSTMWKDAVNPRSRYNLDQVIVDWYMVAFGDKPPLKVSRRILLTVLQYELLFQGYTAENFPMTAKFLQNYEASKYLINEPEKAIARFTQTSKSLLEFEACYMDTLNEPLNFKERDDIMSTQKKSLPVPGGTAEATTEAKGKTKKMSDLMQFFFDKLMEGKFTDEQIALAAKEKFGASYNGNPGYIVICRQNINKGSYGTAPAKQIERLVDNKGTIVSASSVTPEELEALIREAKKGTGKPRAPKAAKLPPAAPVEAPKSTVAPPARKSAPLPTRRTGGSGSNPPSTMGSTVAPGLKRKV